MRVTVDKDPAAGTARVVQEDEYYAFDLRVNAYDFSNGNRNLYNGKELQADLANQFDYGARLYDPVIGRFTTVDPLATKYPWYAPYQFAGNEVPNAIDRDGLEPAYRKPDGTYSLARDGQLQRRLTGDEAKVAAAYSNGRTEIGGANNVPGIFNELAGLAGSILGPINTLVTGENMDGSKANGFDYAMAPLQILAALPMEGGEGGGGGRVRLPDESFVVRGGMNTPESLSKISTETHPSGVTGVSVECGSCSIKELSKNIPHGKIGVTTVGEVRAAGGDVIQTTGASKFHATLTNLPPEIASRLLNPVYKNPNKH